jgi:hypothetical protein
MGNSESTRAFVEIARESSTPGTLPGSPVAYALGYNTIEGFAPTIEMVARDPIDPSNMPQAGQPVDKMANGTIQMDLTLGHARRTLEGAMRAAFTGPAPNLATSSTTAHFVVPTMAAAYPARTLVYVQGCANAANNGLKQVDAGGTTTQIPIVGGLVAETGMAARGVTVTLAGYRFATSDATIVSGNLVVTAKNLTDFGLLVGQPVVIGSVPGTATNANRFANATNRGQAYIKAAVTATTMQLEGGAAFVDDAGTGKEIDLFYGQDIRTRYVTDASYAEPTDTYEVTHHKLGAGDVPAYTYLSGGHTASWVGAFPEKAKATLAVQVVGLDCGAPVTSRTAGFSAAIPILQKSMINTTSNVVVGRIRKKSDGAARTTYITGATISLEQQTERNGAHGVMGAVEITQGKVIPKAQVNAFFTKPEIITDLVNGEIMDADWMFANVDGAMTVRLPSCQLSNGQPQYPAGKVVTIDLDVPAVEDALLNTTCIVSLLAHVPLV